VTLLVNFDLTPQQHCKRAHLTMCQSQYYKHNFAVLLSTPVFTTNIIVPEFVKYAENIICCIFWHKNIYSAFFRSSSKGYSINQFHNNFTIPENNVPILNRIGGGHEKIDVKKFKMEFVSPHILFALGGVGHCYTWHEQVPLGCFSISV
jgi:hypothetical protein